MRGGGQLPWILAFISIAQSSRSCQPSQPAAVLGPGAWLRGGSRWTISFRHRKPGQSVRGQGKPRGPLRMPSGAHRPPHPGWTRGRCHLPPARAVPSHACSSKPVSSMSPELPPLCPGPSPALPRELRFGAHSLYQQGGAAAPTLDAATPSWTLTHPHFPGPTETRPALQPNSGKADGCEYVQGPGILTRLPHSIRSIIGGGCATALPRSWALRELSAQAPGEPWDRARRQRGHLWAAVMASARRRRAVWLCWKLRAQVPVGPMGVSVRQRGPHLQLQPHLAVPCEPKATQGP